jgi:hypothetical protein
MYILMSLFSIVIVNNDLKDDKKAIKSIIIDIVKSAENRDASRVEKSYHKDYSQYLDFMGAGIGRSTKLEYQEALKMKKIGGDALDYKIISMDIDKSIAFANVTITSETIDFYNFLTFMKENGSWYLVQRTLRVEMKKQ